MATLRQDPLLGIARALLTFILILTVFAGAVLVLATPVVLLYQDRVIAEVTKQASAIPPDGFISAICAVLALATVMTALAFVFVRYLRRIVDTVAAGDPFIPANAARLRAMAWLSIVLQVVAVVAGAVTVWLEHALNDLQVNDFEANFDVSIGGILLPLVLFILARVFRTGAAMRDELEGTV